MAEFDIREEMFNRDFLQGFFTDYTVKGLSMTPLLQKQSLSDDTYTWIEEDMSVEKQIQLGRIHAPRKLAEGAKLEEIRVEGIHTKTGAVEKRGYMLTISNNLVKRQPTVARSILNRMGKLAYGLGRWIEESVWTTVKAEAIKNGITGMTAEPIIGANAKLQRGLVDYEMAYDSDEFNQELNTLIYKKEDLGDVRKQLNDNEVVTQNRLVDGWKNGRAFNYMDITHMRGNMFQAQGEILGFDRNIDFGTVYYGVEEGAYNPKVLTGMESFAPLINVTVQQPEEWMIPKETTIRMLASCGTSIETPHALMYDNNLSA
ncbi:MAG: hypothetical protein K8E24_014345 [Methanobacterium paludis]|nr:hypothetical protein [Methanobacterium paludis]